MIYKSFKMKLYDGMAEEYEKTKKKLESLYQKWDELAAKIE